ncbi:NAD(P)(+)--arginine ADP-ribosyltransferase 1-like [Salminus brasiliensis]|uniref:NAD(P)(+)--arginine ADP-ribosyltransferase 1-like n=1 Tax=Salminus brasiliensis TaxID=930266 RepID=UPI003B82CCB6
MKMTVSVVSLFLLTVSLSIRKSSGQVVPLDMAVNSIDDSFEGCSEKMSKKVMTEYFEKETKEGYCKDAWKNALSNHTKGSLGEYQSAAIHLYTQPKEINKQCSYVQFNDACREGKGAYVSGNFQFYTLYYFLTDAIQKLKKRWTQMWCVTAYRRTKLTFTELAIKQKIRFGSFTSSSLKKKCINFGNVTCFKINTCFGAKLGKYSAVKHEEEVLIPPYEVFRVTGIKNHTNKNKLWCQVVYELKSAGKRSDLQCNKTNTEPYPETLV